MARITTNFVALLLIALAFIEPQLLSANDWIRFRSSVSNSGEGLEQDITQNSISTMQLKWQFATGSPVVASPSVATINNVPMVFVGSENHIFYALNASSGAQIWSVTTGGPIATAANVDTSNLTFGPVVYFASGDGCVYSATAAAGVINWTHCYGAGISFFAPLFAEFDGRILIIAYNSGSTGVLQALNESNGAIIWSFSSGAPFIAAPANSPVSNRPGSHLLIATIATQMLALQAGTGKLLSTFNLGAQAVGFPVMVTIGSTENDSCNSFDTRQVWVAQAAGSNAYLIPLDSNTGFTSAVTISLTSPVTAGPASFFLSSFSNHTFRDPDTGLLITCTMHGSGDELFYPSASSILEAVVIQNSGSAAAGGHEAVGSSPLNIEPTFSLDESNPFGGSGVVFVPSVSGTLFAVTAPGGAVTPIFTAHGNIEGSVAIAASRLYFADNAGFIYAVSPNAQ